MRALNETQQTAEAHWGELQEVLDLGLAKLREQDRQAILLRFYERKSFAEIGAILGTAEEAARKRVSRAVEQMRGFFSKSGHTIPATILATLLFAKLSTPAPAALAGHTTAAALGTHLPRPAADAMSRSIERNMIAAKARWIASSIAAVVVLALTSAAVITLTKNAMHDRPEEPQRVTAPSLVR